MAPTNQWVDAFALPPHRRRRRVGPVTLDLSGVWKVAPTSAELERDGADTDLDDGDWLDLDVPGHWGQHPALAEATGPIVFRRHFTVASPADGERAWLRFDGVFSEAEVWLDGRHLGDIGAYFATHRFEITDLLAAGPDDGSPERHLLSLTVGCGDGDTRVQRSLIGSYQSGPLAPPGSPGGIWGDVGIETTGDVAITHSQLLCTEADESSATLRFRVTVDAAEAGPTRIDTSIVGPDGRTAGGATEHELASGENALEWTIPIAEPLLWWPASMGEQPRYDVTVAVRADGNAVSDRRHWRTGLRTVSVDNLRWTVNGKPLFVKGIAVGPNGRFPGAVPDDRYRRDIRSVVEAGLDLARIQGHISAPALYDEADAAGVLLWQDLPLVGAYAAGTRGWAASMATAAVEHLGHHPSVSLWCAHDEPNGPPFAAAEIEDDVVAERLRRLGRHLLPSWNRSVLDPLLRRALRRSDPSRAVVTRSGNLPNPADPMGSDSHLWLGWYAGNAEDLAPLVRRWPRLGTFIGAIGTQSTVVRDWPANAPDWSTAQRGPFARYVPRAAYSDGESWALATQAYQASVIRTQIETARRLKYRPTGGFCVVALFDAESDGGFGVLDAGREPKPAYDALIDACRPVVVIGDLPPAVVTPGQSLELQVHAVNDLHHSLGPVKVTATATLGRWRHKRRWAGHLDADTCSLIGTLDIDVPNSTGAMVIDLELEAEDHVVTNRYQTVVIPPSEAMRPATAEPPS
ncbi:MAG: hypothetical protein AAGD35_07285 [Actinomycetota bacterium]